MRKTVKTSGPATAFAGWLLLLCLTDHRNALIAGLGPESARDCDWFVLQNKRMAGALAHCN